MVLTSRDFYRVTDFGVRWLCWGLAGITGFAAAGRQTGQGTSTTPSPTTPLPPQFSHWAGCGLGAARMPYWPPTATTGWRSAVAGVGTQPNGRPTAARKTATPSDSTTAYLICFPLRQK